jgi:hypothetical protein
MSFEPICCCTHAPFEPPTPSAAIHIIWNVLLTDKLTPLTPQLVDENKVAHIIAILPKQSDYDELTKTIADVPHTVLEYGDAHTPSLPRTRYRPICELIDTIARANPTDSNKRNVLIFCNNGYQRSLPFLAYYLTEFHPSEVPTIERAVDLILPQVNREEYAKIRHDVIKSLKIVFSENI